MSQYEVVAHQVKYRNNHSKNQANCKADENVLFLEETLVTPEQYVKDQDGRNKTYHAGKGHFKVHVIGKGICFRVIRI